MDSNEFLEVIDGELEYLLVDFDPTVLDDEALTEAVLDLQEIYRTVISIATDSGLYEPEEDEVEELDFDLD